MPRAMSRSLAAFVALLLMVAPALAQSKVAAGIQKLEDAWGAAFNKGDAAAVAAMYTDDAYVLPAGAPMVHGRADIQNFWSRAMQKLGDIKCTTVDAAQVSRAGVREVGTCTFKTKGASPQDGALKYVVVWRKVAGQWLLNTDIWNMDK